MAVAMIFYSATDGRETFLSTSNPSRSEAQPSSSEGGRATKAIDPWWIVDPGPENSRCHQ
jgi:hypothetical protein